MDYNLDNVVYSQWYEHTICAPIKFMKVNVCISCSVQPLALGVRIYSVTTVLGLLKVLGLTESYKERQGLSAVSKAYLTPVCIICLMKFICCFRAHHHRLRWP